MASKRLVIWTECGGHRVDLRSVALQACVLAIVLSNAFFFSVCLYCGFG